MTRRWLAVFTSVAVAGCFGCSDDDAEVPRALQSEAFDEAVTEICERHGDELESWGDGLADVVGETPEERLETAIESDRRRLIDLKRDLIEELRRIEPARGANAWDSALDRYEAAIDRAASGPRVDVRADDLGAATSALIDDFGLEGCF